MANVFNKKKWVIALASAALGVCTLAAVGCGEKVEQIAITKNNMPQQVYVLGNDLNLAGGKLTVVIDGKRSEVPLTDPEVSISGYDKNKLGEQALTVTYKEQTTVLKVSVVPRISVAKYETSYFVGESFNEEKGELTITADNGESTFVSISDDAVSISGFDSASANEALPLTITYDNGEVSYESTFTVGIYDALEVDFRAPNKKAYKSHDTALDVTGGYIALKNGDFVKYVTLTADMISGFDLSEATEANLETPVEQDLTVNYCGYEKTYEVQILFSSVSLINLRADEMSQLNWTSSELPAECTTEMGEDAMQAMELYFAMLPEELALVEEGAADHIAKVAAIYGLEKWQEAFASYKDAFYLSESGTLAWDCSDFNKTKEAYQKILNKDPILYNDATVLGQIAEQFAEVVFVEEGDTMADVLSVVYTPATIDEFAEQLQLMISLHETLSVVPDEWTLDMLKSQYSEAIQNAWVILFETKFKGLNFRSLYYLTSKWRTNNDYFDILYTYYYDMGDEGMTKINAFKDLRLPGELETLYGYALSARNELVYMQQGMVGESVNFMRSYEEALLQKQAILNSNDSMMIDLYEKLEFDFLFSNGQGGYAQVTFDTMLSNFYRASFGYVQNFNTYLGIKNYEQLWDSFSAALKRASETEGYFKSEQYAQDAQGLLAAYLGLTPKQQLAFMGLIHPFYVPSATNPGRYPMSAWENDGEGTNSQFTFFIYNYYESVLPESTHEMFTELMLASESLANLMVAGGIESFFEHMENFATQRDRVISRNEQDWLDFQDIVGWVLFDMEAMETKFAPLKTGEATEPTHENLTDEELKDFENLLNACYEAYSMMMVYQMNAQRVNIAIVFYAQMEKVEEYSKKLLSSEDPRILNAYYFDNMYLKEPVVMPDGSTATFGGSMDMLVFLVREEYTNALTSGGYTADELLYDAYQRINVKDFLQEASYIYFNYIYMTLLPSGEENVVYFEDEEKMMSIQKAYREDLNDEQRYFLILMDSNIRIYHSSFVRFGKERNAKMGKLLEQLCSLEFMYVYYMQHTDGEEGGKSYKELLLEQYEDMKYFYTDLEETIEEEKLKDADKQNAQVLSAMDDFMRYFGEMYNYYVEKCDALAATNA